jgi:hypothetical protein
MVRGNPKKFEGFKFNHGTHVVGAGSPKPGEHHFCPPPLVFFDKKNNNLIIINLITKKIRAGNEPLTASSRKSGTGEKKKNKKQNTLWGPTVLCPVFHETQRNGGFQIFKMPAPTGIS